MLFPTAKTGKIATGEALGAGTGNESSLRNRKGGGGRKGEHTGILRAICKYPPPSEAQTERPQQKKQIEQESTGKQVPLVL